MPDNVTRRILFWSPALLGLIVVLFLLFRPQPVQVDLAGVSRGPMVRSVAEEGKTRVKEVFVVSAPIPGLMRRIEIHAGDPVVAATTVVASASCTRQGDIIQPLMGPLGMIIVQVLRDQIVEMIFAKYDEMAETFLLDTLDPAFNKSIHPRRQLHRIATMRVELFG